MSVLKHLLGRKKVLIGGLNICCKSTKKGITDKFNHVQFFMKYRKLYINTLDFLRPRFELTLGLYHARRGWHRVALYTCCTRRQSWYDGGGDEEDGGGSGDDDEEDVDDDDGDNYEGVVIVVDKNGVA